MQALDCTDIKALLSGLVDDEVDAETRHAAERHLADCPTCRALIDEAEALNGLIAAETSAGGEELPPDFAGAVLGRTVYAQAAPARAGHGWTNWLGWLAAAASLLLAVSLLVMDGGPAPTGAPVATAPRAVMPARSADLHRSYVFEGDDAAATGADGAPRPRAADTTASTRRQLDRPQLDRPQLDRPQLDRPQLDRPQLAALASRPLLAREDAETLDSAALALQTLLVDDETFDRLGEIRRIVDYEELLPRLAEARQRLSAEDRPAVFACESALFRIRYGSDETGELAELADAIDRAELAGQLMKISGRWAAQSL